MTVAGSLVGVDELVLGNEKLGVNVEDVRDRLRVQTLTSFTTTIRHVQRTQSPSRIRPTYYKSLFEYVSPLSPIHIPYEHSRSQHLFPPTHKQSKRGSSGWVQYTILGLGWGGSQGLQPIRTLIHLHHPGRWGWEWDAALIRTPTRPSHLKHKLSQMGSRGFWVNSRIRGWGMGGYHGSLSLSSGESSHCGGGVGS